MEIELCTNNVPIEFATKIIIVRNNNSRALKFGYHEVEAKHQAR